jgi:hypothetical protein
MYENCQSGLTTKKAHENGKCSCVESVYSCLFQNNLLGTGAEDVEAMNDERKAFFPLKATNLF